MEERSSCGFVITSARHRIRVISGLTPVQSYWKDAVSVSCRKKGSWCKMRSCDLATAASSFHRGSWPAIGFGSCSAGQRRCRRTRCHLPLGPGVAADLPPR